MAEPVRHGFWSGAATTAWETVKGVVKGAIFLPVAGAVVGGAAFALIGLVTSAPLSLAAVGFGALAGGLFGAAVDAYAMPYLATVGGILGVFKGGKRVSAESQAYQEKLELHQRAGLSKLEYAAQAGAAQGYAMGRQQGQQEGAMMVAEKLREMQYAQLAQKMGPAKGMHVAAEEQRRAEAAKASPQLG